MHEMGLVYGLFDSLRDIIKQNQLTGPLKKVVLDVGEASMVVDSYMMDCWNMAKGDTEFKQTELVLHKIETEGRCNHCGKVFRVKEHDRKCPYCGTYDDFIPVTGLGIEISEIAVDE